MNTHQELYDYMEYIVKRYFKFYRLRYLNNSIEFEDLIQEAYIVTSLLLEKIKAKKVKNRSGIVLDIDNFIEVKRFIGNAVGRRMNDIKRLSMRDKLVGKTVEKVCTCSTLDRNELDGYCINCHKPLVFSAIEVSLDSFDNTDGEINEGKEDEIGLDILIADMEKICLAHPLIKPLDFRMFCEKYIDNKTYEEIGNKYNVTRQRVKQKVDNTAKRLRKYF